MMFVCGVSQLFFKVRKHGSSFFFSISILVMVFVGDIAFASVRVLSNAPARVSCARKELLYFVNKAYIEIKWLFIFVQYLFYANLFFIFCT